MHFETKHGKKFNRESRLTILYVKYFKILYNEMYTID